MKEYGEGLSPPCTPFMYPVMVRRKGRSLGGITAHPKKNVFLFSINTAAVAAAACNARDNLASHVFSQ